MTTVSRGAVVFCVLLKLVYEIDGEIQTIEDSASMIAQLEDHQEQTKLRKIQ